MYSGSLFYFLEQRRVYCRAKQREWVVMLKKSDPNPNPSPNSKDFRDKVIK